MENLAGTSLGQYRLTELIRRSGTSTIYKAHQPSLDRYVAVKVLRHSSDPQFAARFQREARAIGQLEHHNILPIYDYGEQDGLLFFVMQYVENGLTLSEILGQPIEPRRALRLTDHILAGLDYAHLRGVIHRDIKPSNILLPLPNWPLLADFGLAKLVDEQYSLTMPGLVVGTAAYIAPEQAAGQPADQRTDLYALGIVLYEMLTGRVPFDAPTPMALLKKQAYEPPPPPRSLNPNLPEAVETALLRALEKDPNARYQSARQMAEDLKQVTGQIERSETHIQKERLYEAALQSFAEASWSTAIERLGQLIALDPHDRHAADMLAAAEEARQRAQAEARQQLVRLGFSQRSLAPLETYQPAAAKETVEHALQSDTPRASRLPVLLLVAGGALIVVLILAMIMI